MIDQAAIARLRGQLSPEARVRAGRFAEGLRDWRREQDLELAEAAHRLLVGTDWLAKAEGRALDPRALTPSLTIELHRRTGFYPGGISADETPPQDTPVPAAAGAETSPGSASNTDRPDRKVRAHFEVPGTIALAIDTAENRLTLTEAARLHIALGAALAQGRKAGAAE
ncbi:hypothetical protein [Sphingomonas jatrophae]|uniref:Uncharacterized protein n=1 Tax=Sphingomonas jatrophae TaxID=1166337 RepID=A0A1I6K6G4_9SPHN|nr:hypothetical protein [Sphingomonas jatrophae]SFR86734.1 hypothetical protein SAMN05192580_1371 [Sphingomonas jatrophae]